MSDGMLFDVENTDCLNCGRPLTSDKCVWCDPPKDIYKSDMAAKKIATSRDKAISRVDAHADIEWKVKAYTIGEQIARENETMISEDIWDALTRNGFTTHEPRAMGAVMRKLNSRKVVEATDRFITSPSPLGHGRPTRVWRSLIFTGVLRASEPDDRNSTTHPVPASPPRSPISDYLGCAYCGSERHTTRKCPDA